ncbi:Bromodomain-like superfamily [Sesbania bispinosa]|nr:Bromodomain-like superfamily [Sesbania bispinosa]
MIEEERGKKGEKERLKKLVDGKDKGGHQKSGKRWRGRKSEGDGSDREEEERTAVEGGSGAPLRRVSGIGIAVGCPEKPPPPEREVKSGKVDSKGLHSVSVSGIGTPANPPSGIPLPDRRTLELILDKLQKKDTYGVFAEPVDPEELPNYHDVIEHPMDFSTVRKKLANGSYPTLEQFESDVFLICSNAMQYNAPETIYHKQARSIQELGRKKFEKLRIGFERSQIELKSEQKTRSNSLVKKSVKKPLGCASQEPVGFDFSSGATLVTIGDVQPISYPMQGGSCERPGNIDGIVEGNAFLIEANQEKAEDVLSGKGQLSKFGRKSSVLDENRRASYNMSNQPITRSDSIFMTFESEMKHLVTVGLHTEYSYARSLARFSASLGPIAWKLASHRIQQALPAGCKFGHGWVGEYEPFPTPILMLNNRVQKETSLVMKLHSTTELLKGGKSSKNVETGIEHPVNGQMLEGKHTSICPASGTASGGNPLFGSAGVRPNASLNLLNQKQNVQPRNFDHSESKGELSSLPSGNQNNSSLIAKFTSNAPTAEAKPRDMVPRNMNAFPSTPFKQSNANGVVSGELPDGEVMNTSLNSQVTGPSSESTSIQTSRAAPFVVHGQQQGLGDPVQSMRMFAEKAQKQQASSNHSPVDTPPVTPSAPSGQSNDSGNAAAAAARVWMSVAAGGFKQGPENSISAKNQISADSLYQMRQFHQHISQIRGEFPSGGMSFQSDKNNFPFKALGPQPIHTGTVSQFPNQSMVFPQLASPDQSRLQMQSSWRGLSPCSQPRQKQEALAPDLNIGFQSPGSPAKQSSGVLVDSQQPDLALQL